MRSRTSVPLAVVVSVLAGTLVGCTNPAPAPPTEAPTTVPTASASASASESAPPALPDISAELRALETTYDARVGVSAVGTKRGERISYRADERFGYASAFKAFVAAEFLHDVPVDQRGELVTFTQADVDAAGYSPITSENIGAGMTLSELAEAAVRNSDNTATNLILERLGGPAALDAGLTELGDSTTEAVNFEPELNTIEEGSTEDTSTAHAFTADIDALLDGFYLAEADKTTLVDWMSGNATGDNLIRAGAPEGWLVADKSGGAGGIRNDVAIVTPPSGDPIALTIFTTKNAADAEYDDALVAEVARVVLGVFAGR
jgi:beta-lactamase class A